MAQKLVAANWEKGKWRITYNNQDGGQNLDFNFQEKVPGTDSMYSVDWGYKGSAVVSDNGMTFTTAGGDRTIEGDFKFNTKKNVFEGNMDQKLMKDGELDCAYPNVTVFLQSPN